MKYKIVLPAILASLTSACSPVNSMAPFDSHQAAIVARSMYPVNAYSATAIRGSTKSSVKYESER